MDGEAYLTQCTFSGIARGEGRIENGQPGRIDVACGGVTLQHDECVQQGFTYIRLLKHPHVTARLSSPFLHAHVAQGYRVGRRRVQQEEAPRRAPHRQEAHSRPDPADYRVRVNKKIAAVPPAGPGRAGPHARRQALPASPRGTVLLQRP